MRHYLTEQEFKEFLLKERRDGQRFEIAAEDDHGDTSTITFIEKFFFSRIFLYTLPLCFDVGVIQEDIDDGWDTPIHDVWLDITSTCGWKPFITVKDNNVF